MLQLDVKFRLLHEPFSGVGPLLQGSLSTKGFTITDHNDRTTLRASTRTPLLTNGFCRPTHYEEELLQRGRVPTRTFT
ncbi:hypothetical protein [Pontibacter actiniarum]|uniref:Uncharacterized protein n=1 Tax=Pontibacter actiniarum TaxID=323450 RepID=A0A1X9YXM0_9BACT|nr:hypothetical protein [Pontibacter actiniarum]ARS37494.1 hypothetical protein CA264_19840 [Pontibacter actiniarum]